MIETTCAFLAGLILGAGIVAHIANRALDRVLENLREIDETMKQ